MIQDNIWNELQYSSDLTRVERDCLIYYWRELQKKAPLVPLIYLEIGVFFGGTFKMMLDEMKANQSGYAVGIDLFETHVNADDNTHVGGTCFLQELQDDLTAKGYPNFRLIKGNSYDEILKLASIPYGLVFIDGNHTYKNTMLDFLTAYAHIQSGYFVFHNSCNNQWPDTEYIQKDGGPHWVVKTILANIPAIQLCGQYDRSAVLYKP